MIKHRVCQSKMTQQIGQNSLPAIELNPDQQHDVKPFSNRTLQAKTSTTPGDLYNNRTNNSQD